MRICLLTLTTTEKYTGIAHYLDKIITFLQKNDKDNEYLIYTSKDNYKFFSITEKNFKEVRLPINQCTYFDRLVYYFWHIFVFPFWSTKKLTHLQPTKTVKS